MISLTINIVANMIMLISVVMFYLYLYGDNSKVVHRWNFVGHWSLKLGLIGIAVGNMYNVLSLCNPPTSELVLNVGLAIVFLWAYMFHKKMFAEKFKKNG